MAALTQDANACQVGGGGVKVVGPAHQADTFYAGALLFALNVHTTGKVSCVPTSGTAERFLGICSKRQVTTAADQLVEYFVGGVFLFPAIASIDATEIGSFLVADKSGTISDNPADLVAAGDITPLTGDCVIGRIVGLDGSSNIYVDLNVAGLIITSTTLATQ
jgi:hypothetical protein